MTSTSPTDVTTVNAERDLQRAVRRYEAKSFQLKEATDERDRAIREAIAAGMPRAMIVAITGLHRNRIDQIRRGARL